MTSLPVLIAVLHGLLFVSALCLRHDQERPASAITRNLGAAVWGTVTACLAAVICLSARADVLPQSTLAGNLVLDRWCMAFTACSMAVVGVGMFAGADPGRGLLLAAVAGLAAGSSSWGSIAPVLLLGWLQSESAFSRRLPAPRSFPWNSFLCTLLAVLGIGIAVWNSKGVGTTFRPALEATAAVCFLCGAGGLIRWFPFPSVARTEGDRRSLGEVLAEVVLPGLSVLAILARLVVHFQTESALGVLIIASSVPALVAGARLPFQEHLADFSGWLNLQMLSLLCGPLCLLLWEQARPQVTEANIDLGYWTASGLAGGETLLASGLLTLVSSVLLMTASLLAVTPSEASGQFFSSLDGSLSRRPTRTILALTGLWFAASLPPSPGHWWRLKLIASLSIAHRQSSLTRLFEPYPAFLVFIGLLSIAWGLAILGTIRVLARILWEEPLSHPSAGSRLAIFLSLLLLCLTLLTQLPATSL